MDCPPVPQINEVGDVENGIALSSASHASLFYHDEEIICTLQAQTDIANAYISSLEERLRNSSNEFQITCNLLYESKIALCNEVQSRLAFHRHLRLEQHRYDECAEARLSLSKQNCQMEAQLRELFLYKEMMRQEIEHDKGIIESMAWKLSEYGHTADDAIELVKELSHGTAEQDSQLMIKSQSPQPPAFVMVQPPQFPELKTEEGNQCSSTAVRVNSSTKPPGSTWKANRTLGGSGGRTQEGGDQFGGRGIIER